MRTVLSQSIRDVSVLQTLLLPVFCLCFLIIIFFQYTLNWMNKVFCILYRMFDREQRESFLYRRVPEASVPL